MKVTVYADIWGLEDLKKSLKKIGDVPQKHVTASSKKGMNIALRKGFFLCHHAGAGYSCACEII